MKMKRMFIFFFSGAFLVLFVLQSCEKKEENPSDTGVTITETGGSTDVTEGGNTDTYSVVLAYAPSQDVMIGITGDNQVTVDKNLLTFTAANWNVSQAVTVTAVDDNIPEGDHTGTINHSSASGDANWTGLNIPAVTVHITDNDLSLILAGSRTGHYVVVDPVTGVDIVENQPNIHTVGRHCLGHLSKKVIIISPPGAGTFVNCLYVMDRQTAASPMKITNEAN
jgi:hypothetical protein